MKWRSGTRDAAVEGVADAHAPTAAQRQLFDDQVHLGTLARQRLTHWVLQLWKHDQHVCNIELTRQLGKILQDMGSYTNLSFCNRAIMIGMLFPLLPFLTLVPGNGNARVTLHAYPCRDGMMR